MADDDKDLPKVTARDIVKLIWASYGVLIPRVLLFALIFLFITWFITEVLL